jgi:hypothetical protein
VADAPRKRKRRDGAPAGSKAEGRQADTDTNGTVANGAGAARPKTPRERMEAGYAKAEVRNQAAREALAPLADGERPPVVTVSAILAALVALSIVIAFAAGLKVNGRDPAFSTAAAPTLIMAVLAWGMWKARYWAVICFQIVLVILILTAVYRLLVIATSAWDFAVTLLLLAVSGTLFWLMVKAMARIQMLDRVPPQ